MTLPFTLDHFRRPWTTSIAPAPLPSAPDHFCRCRATSIGAEPLPSAPSHFSRSRDISVCSVKLVPDPVRMLSKKPGTQGNEPFRSLYTSGSSRDFKDTRDKAGIAGGPLLCVFWAYLTGFEGFCDLQNAKNNTTNISEPSLHSVGSACSDKRPKIPSLP